MDARRPGDISDGDRHHSLPHEWSH
jgi:hypothetical protein